MREYLFNPYGHFVVVIDFKDDLDNHKTFGYLFDVVCGVSTINDKCNVLRDPVSVGFKHEFKAEFMISEFINTAVFKTLCNKNIVNTYLKKLDTYFENDATIILKYKIREDIRYRDITISLEDHHGVCIVEFYITHEDIEMIKCHKDFNECDKVKLFDMLRDELIPFFGVTYFENINNDYDY